MASRRAWSCLLNRLRPPPPIAVSSAVSHNPSSCATCLRSASRGLLATASSMTSTTPCSLADGSPSPPGANVSAIAVSAARCRGVKRNWESGMDEDLVEQVVALSGRDVVIVRPRDGETLIDDQAFEDDEYIPYWADLWPSAELLARTLIGRALRGARVLELGCGLGLPSVAAALAGGRVMSTDWAPEALEAVRRNAERNGISLETAVCDWRAPPERLCEASWDLVIAADVVYERRNAEPVCALLERLDTETWLADPGRAPCEQLLADLELAGWERSDLAATATPRVTV